MGHVEVEIAVPVVVAVDGSAAPEVVGKAHLHVLRKRTVASVPVESVGSVVRKVDVQVPIVVDITDRDALGVARVPQAGDVHRDVQVENHVELTADEERVEHGDIGLRQSSETVPAREALGEGQMIDERVWGNVLTALIAHPNIPEFWKTLSEKSGNLDDVQASLLLYCAYKLAIGPSDAWVAFPNGQRRKKLDSILASARKLRHLVQNTPLDNMSGETLFALGVDIPDVRYVDGKSDMAIVLNSLEEEAQRLKHVSPLLKKTRGKHPKLLYFYIRMDEHFCRHYGQRMYGEIATIAAAIFGEGTTSDQVRKALAKWKKARAAPN